MVSCYAPTKKLIVNSRVVWQVKLLLTYKIGWSITIYLKTTSTTGRHSFGHMRPATLCCLTLRIMYFGWSYLLI